ncbi:MAG: GNAT family N-acetyltransferase [Cyclobacteriaceae bacterium]|nr:GNAT family N-acetyltransferase [Cyclobacteriaceae bacterium]MCH8515020.1 GNAT family N-acetyltransferase [Cyclobacteriaceae bacterium]
MSEFKIRKGTAADVPVVMQLIKELAEYEKAPEEVVITEEQLLADGFGERPYYHLFIAELANGEIAGIALYFYAYSTWKGKCVYLEDLVVTEKHRGKGIGLALIREIILLAKRENAGRVAWQVLDWNEPAIQFYKKLGANLDSGWINCKMHKGELELFE